MFVARRISRAKWDPKAGLAPEEIAADAVTGDLRTQANSLSFWECGSGGPRDVEDVALAVAAAAERLDRVDLVLLATADLEADGQSLTRTEGRTPVAELTKLHVDLRQLDYVRLGNVARLVATALASDQRRRLTKSTVRKLLVAAVAQNRVQLTELSEKLRSEVLREVGPGP